MLEWSEIARVREIQKATERAQARECGGITTNELTIYESLSEKCSVAILQLEILIQDCRSGLFWTGHGPGNN